MRVLLPRHSQRSGGDRRSGGGNASDQESGGKARQLAISAF